MDTDIDMEVVGRLPVEEDDCCSEKYTTERGGFYVCINCGITERDNKIYDQNPYGIQDGKTFQHSFASDLYPQSNLGTYVQGNSKLARRQQWNSMPYKERVIWEVSIDLTSRLNGIFPDSIITDAIHQYKSLYSSMDIHRGKNKKGIVAACVYFAANNKNSKISPKKLANIMDVDVSTLNKSISIFIENTKLDFKISKAEDYAQGYCNKFNVNFDIQKLLVKMCSVIEDSDILAGSVPQNICLSSLYFIISELGQNKLSMKYMCEEYNVSPNTISKILETINKNKNYIFSRLK